MPHFVSIFINFLNVFEPSVHMSYHLRQTHCILSRRVQDPVFLASQKDRKKDIREAELVNLKA